MPREGGRAIRYGIGVGKVEAFDFSGVATVERKGGMALVASDRRDDRARAGALRPARGRPGGRPGQPARAARDLPIPRRVDTLYRLHGTVEPRSIGTRLSSGCVRLFNQDIIDLYRRVPVGSRVVVLSPITV